MSSRISKVACLATGFVLALATSDAFGQLNYNRPSVNAFRNTLSRPTVSPYLNLLDRQGFGLPRYFTQVRPQLEQRERLAEQQAQIGMLQQQFNVLSRQSATQQQQPGTIRATGHPTRFMNLSHFYPGFGPR